MASTKVLSALMSMVSMGSIWIATRSAMSRSFQAPVSRPCSRPCSRTRRPLATPPPCMFQVIRSPRTCPAAREAGPAGGRPRSEPPALPHRICTDRYNFAGKNRNRPDRLFVLADTILPSDAPRNPDFAAPDPSIRPGLEPGLLRVRGVINFSSSRVARSAYRGTPRTDPEPMPGRRGGFETLPYSAGRMPPRRSIKIESSAKCAAPDPDPGPRATGIHLSGGLLRPAQGWPLRQAQGRFWTPDRGPGVTRRVGCRHVMNCHVPS